MSKLKSGKAVFVALLGILAIVVMSIFSPAAMAASQEKSISQTCSPIGGGGGDRALIYYVNNTSGAVVRSNHSLYNDCVITTLNYQEDIIRDPSTAAVNQDGYTWIKVSYYLGHCQTCTNYAWSVTGWVATANLTAATHNYTCVELYGCPSIGGKYGAWPIPPVPVTPTDCSNYQQYHSDFHCTWFPENYQIDYVGQETATTDPNWWYESNNCDALEVGCAYVWNFDWWAN